MAIDPNSRYKLSIPVDDENTIVDYYAHEQEETIVLVIQGGIALGCENYLHEINVDALDQLGINWQAPTPEQLAALCLDEEVGIYA